MPYHWLYQFHDVVPAFNVFRYITVRTIYAALTAMILSLLIEKRLTAWLKRYQIGQMIREDGPRSHLNKSGTPTMGGLMILVATLTAMFIWADLTNDYVRLLIFTMILFGAIGFWDDYLKCVKKNAKGLPSRHKFGLQLFAATLAAIGLYRSPAYSTVLSVPFFKNVHPDMGLWYIPFAIFVIVGASNAVNLTDGLDGLAIGPIVIVFATYMIITYVTGHQVFSKYLLIPHIEGAGEVAVFCGAVVGAGLGFLWFNAYPASLFMGDVGSLSLGGVLGVVALISKHEILLAWVGGVFVVEALSVMIQVASFKSRGKRVFLMAPLHHHFELKGWAEPKVIVRFWIVSFVLAMIGLSTLKLR